jgi:hypothetical protein
MNPLSGNWKKWLFILAAGLALIFASRHSVDGQAAAAQPAPPAAAQPAADDGTPPSNEISEFQQLD